MDTITFYCSVVFLVALYGFEYWPTIKDNKRRFADMGTKMLRRCCEDAVFDGMIMQFALTMTH